MKLFQFFIPPLSLQEKKGPLVFKSGGFAKLCWGGQGRGGEAGMESLGEGARSGRGPGPVPTRTQGPPLQVAPLTAPPPPPPTPATAGPARSTMTGPWHRGLAKKSSTAPPQPCQKKADSSNFLRFPTPGGRSPPPLPGARAPRAASSPARSLRSCLPAPPTDRVCSNSQSLSL